MRANQLRLVFASLLMVSGCAIPRSSPPPDVDALARIDSQPILLQSAGLWAQLIDTLPTQSPADQNVAGPRRNILVLSGGGKFGAFSAGVLCGWSAAGTRPPFNIVTGVSTGALIAPAAFLGSQYDHLLADWYTKVRTKDIYTKRPLLALLWRDSLGDSAPLRRLIDELYTDDFLALIAKAHAAGRRLYVATTNLDTGRQVHWDLGAIAAGNLPEKGELFRNILLASCSIPGLLPPVPIEIKVDGRSYTELQADGGVSALMLLPPWMVLEEQSKTGTNVYVIVSGKLPPPPQSVERRFDQVSLQALKELLEAKTQDDLQRVYWLTRLMGGRFAATWIPPDFPVDSESTQFDPKEMRQMFDKGYHLTTSGAAWRALPPGVNPQEWPWPRTDVRFLTRSGFPGAGGGVTRE